MKSKKLFSGIILALLLTSLFSSCVDIKEVGGDSVKYDNVILATDLSKIPDVQKQRMDSVIVASTDISGVFNPLFADAQSDCYINELIFDSLINFDDSGEPVSALATWETSSDGSVYTFKLKDATFADGIPVTADDLIFTMTVMCDNMYYGFYDFSTLNILGFDEYYGGNAQNVSGIKKLDEKTVEVTLTQPNSTFIYNMDFGILSKGYYGEGYTAGDMSSLEGLFGKPMGSGQYKLSDYKTGSSATLTANESYYKGAPKIKNVVFSVTPNGEEVGKIVIGEADLTVIPATENYLKAAKDAGFIDIYRYPSNSFGSIGFNCQNSILSDARVRQAITYATNREGVIGQVFGEYAKVIDIPESSLSWAYTTKDIVKYNFDTDKAAALFKEAGWELDSSGKLIKDGKQMSITIVAETPNEVTDVLLPVMKDDLSRLGVELNIDSSDFSTLVDKVLSAEADMWFLGWGLSADPGAVGGMFISDGPQNIYGYSNTALDDFYKEGKEKLDLEGRKEAYAKAYKVLNNDLPCMPIYQRDDLWLVSGRIGGFMTSPYHSCFKDFYKFEIIK